MRIEKINIAKSIPSNDGLEEIKMNKLGHVVLLAGKNGSGKTRILNKISSVFSLKPTDRDVANAKEQLDILKKELASLIITLESFKYQLNDIKVKDDLEKGEVIHNKINSYESDIRRTEHRIKKNEQIIKYDLIETSVLSHKYEVIHFVPKKLELDDCNNFNKAQIIQKADSISTIGTQSLPSGTFSKIQVIQDQWFSATHQNSTVTESEREQAIVNYNRLRELIAVFLKTDLDRNINDDATLFGFSLGNSKLSDGQKVLLQFCLAIYSQEVALKDLILILDEPENHLHPSVVIETLDRITNIVPNGQIWIATHSIPILAHFDPSFLWYVEEGRIGYAGKIPEKVLSSLLGDENEIQKLKDFISLPGIFALHRHAFESLFHPEAVNTSSSDPQTLQIKDEIKKYLHQSNKIKILDYGAGKGRLLANILDANKEPISKFNKWFDYVAYDKYDFDKKECLSTIERISNTPEKKYFNSFSELFDEHHKESFDIIIMCNVLHEIDPNDWLSLFSSGGSISDALSDNGILLIIEDQRMPIGEKAYQKGFIVLNTPEIRDLFKIKKDDHDFGFSDARGDRRLKAHRLKKEYFTRIDSASKLKALESLHKTAAENIINIRNEKIDYKNGKTHGFWVQQYANTGLALKEIK